MNKHLEEKTAKLEKGQAEQYSCRNNIELAEILNLVRDSDLEKIDINICKEHRIDISLMDIEACHRLPLSNAQATKDPNQCKRVIIKFVNRKLLKHLLEIKKRW